MSSSVHAQITKEIQDQEAEQMRQRWTRDMELQQEVRRILRERRAQIGPIQARKPRSLLTLLLIHIGIKEHSGKFLIMHNDSWPNFADWQIWVSRYAKDISPISTITSSASRREDQVTTTPLSLTCRAYLRMNPQV